MSDEVIIKKSLNEMSKKEFQAVPFAEGWNEIIDFDSLVILPNSEIHDSDYRCMSFICCKGDEPICQIGGGSDVIHIDGIGGYGYGWLYKSAGVPNLVEPQGWSIDCLKKSGLLRMFTHHKLIAGRPLSSFEIYSTREYKSSETQPQ